MKNYKRLTKYVLCLGMSCADTDHSKIGGSSLGDSALKEIESVVASSRFPVRCMDFLNTLLERAEPFGPRRIPNQDMVILSDGTVIKLIKADVLDAIVATTNLATSTITPGVQSWVLRISKPGELRGRYSGVDCEVNKPK